MRTALLATACSLMPWIALPVNTGCLACTLVGARSGVTIQLAAAPGNYRIEATTVDETLSVRLDLTAAGAVVCETECVATGVESLLFIESTVNGGIEARVADAFGDGGPRSLVLKVVRDDVAVHESTIVPDYETVYPNGKRCDPEAQVATVEVVVP
jgi:hypothetical protein